ncbi:MAG: hypothetical protein AAFY76_25580, partial [Cyanobacteria bacterium J06649_11]
KELQNAKKNTQGSTNTWYNVLGSWKKVRNYSSIVTEYPPQELNLIMESFYAKVKRIDGKDYEPDCLRVMQLGIDRYLRDQNYPASIIRSDSFISLRKVFEGKARILKKNGMGKPTNRAKSLTDEEVTYCGNLVSLGEKVQGI